MLKHSQLWPTTRSVSTFSTISVECDALKCCFESWNNRRCKVTAVPSGLHRGRSSPKKLCRSFSAVAVSLLSPLLSAQSSLGWLLDVSSGYLSFFPLVKTNQNPNHQRRKPLTCSQFQLPELTPTVSRISDSWVGLFFCCCFFFTVTVKVQCSRVIQRQRLQI